MDVMTIKEKRTVAGIKGFALCFILAYMAFSQVFPGGHLGYQVLFALFGYLAMNAYIKEKVYSGPFFIRTIRRLWPELSVSVAISSIAYFIFFAEDFPMIRGEALSSLFFVNNLFQGIQGYPLSMDQPSPLGHLWFISLLVQAYFIFCLLIAGRKTRQKIGSVVFIGAMLSIATALLMSLYGGLHLTDSRIFYMPDSRLFSFFIAFPAVYYAAFSKNRTKLESREIAMLGIVIVFVMMTIFMPETNMAYFGGMFLASGLLSLFLLFLFRGDTAFESVFHFPLFTFLGDRAYSIYLYSMPVLFFVRRAAGSAGLSLAASGLIALAALLIAAQASYYVFSVRKMRTEMLVAPLVIVLAVIVYSFSAQPARAMEPVKREKKVVKTVETEAPVETEPPSITEKFQPSDELAAAIEQVNAQKPNYKLTNEDLGRLQSKKALILGDSVAETAQESYLKLMPSLNIEAEKHLTSVWYVDRLKNNAGEGPVILQIGNDGPLTYDEVKEMIEAAEGRPIYLLTVVTDEAYENANNDIINRIGTAYANVTIIDWFKEAKTQTNFFDEEGAMKQPATRLMAHMIAYSLLYDEPATQVKNRGDAIADTDAAR